LAVLAAQDDTCPRVVLRDRGPVARRRDLDQSLREAHSPRLIAFPLQVESPSTGRRRLEEVEQRLGLPRSFGGAIEIFGPYDHDSRAVIFDDPLRALRARAPKQLTETRFRIVNLPQRRVVHRDRLSNGAPFAPVSSVSSTRAAGAMVLTLLVGPAAMAKPVKVGRAMLTFYWTIDEGAARYRGAPDALLCDARGNVIERTSRKFRKALVLEGTGCLRDGRTVTYDRKVHGEHRFRVGKFTATGCALVPYRTVAVDPRFISLGSRIYIPQLKGTRLPDGTIHDGVFVDADAR